jgi:citrate lyase subunit beta/citryl-CoA lyase
MRVRPRRSAFFVPGFDARAQEAAKGLAADTLVFDLEDAVEADAKETARRRVMTSLMAGGHGARERVVRVNPRDTPWGLDDLRAAVASGVDAILIPKADRPGDIMRAAKDLREAGAPERVRLWAMIESPAAILNLDSMLRTAADPSSRLDVVVMGTDDLARETRARHRPGRAGLLAYLSLSIAAARAHGVDILDGAFVDAPGAGVDLAAFRAECEQGRDLGMDGKSLTHPGQIDICNAVFAPPRDEIALAEKIISAFAEPANATKSVLKVEGRVVERMHEEMARRTLELAEAIAART